MLSNYEIVRKLSPNLGDVVIDAEKNEGMRKIKEYVEVAFPDIPAFPDCVIEQLSWLLKNTVYTCESNAKLASNNDWRLTEIKRGFSRYYTFYLLENGNKEAYQNFVQAQPIEDRLGEDSFKRLSDDIRRLSAAALHAIGASCFFTKSNTADNLAKLSGITASVDSEKFLTDTITQCPDIYPIFKELSDGEKHFLPFAFLKDTHLRHMLYTEGGNNMFAVLRNSIKQGLITQEEYEVTLARWYANIGGFLGHVNEKGSLYLTQKTANSIFALKASLDKLWENPDHDVLADYLQKRADWLGVESLYLAHIGALTRLHTKKEGAELQNWFNTFSPEEQKEHEESFEQLRNRVEVTPTYEPAVIGTLKDLGCEISERLHIYAQITKAASAAYCKAVADGELDPSIPLCYREIAFKDNLTPIIEQYRLGGSIGSDIKINEQGVVSSSGSYQSALRVK